MRPADLVRLILLAAIWGGSFLFVRMAVGAIGPLWLTELRVDIAAAAMLIYARAVGISTLAGGAVIVIATALVLEVGKRRAGA